MSSESRHVIAPAISLEGIGKRYGGTSVLRDVSLHLAPGEIHGLLGENGAGKSTLLKIIGGAIEADEGRIAFDGSVVRLGTPRSSMEQGVSLISQELSLVPSRSVLENVFLGRWAHKGGFVAPRTDRAAFVELARATGFALDPDAPVRSLSVGQAQQVEILKALARGSRVLCLDEPTAALGEHDTERLLALVRSLADRGTTIVIVSHFLEEVLSIADRITVLRDGDLIETSGASEHTPQSLVRRMVGREVTTLARRPSPLPDDAPVTFEARGLTNAAITDVSIRARQGEIVGLVGLMGSGRTETLRAIFGADPLASGEVLVQGRPIRRSVRAAMARGIGMVPESRKDDGLVLGRPAAENIALPSLSARQLGGFVSRARERRDVDRVAAMVDIRGAVRSVPVAALSGGNQQKALFAKWLVEPPAVLLVDEPTRGVDVAAKAQIHELILDLAAAGTAVLVASSELEEVLSLSHSLVVLRGGRITARFDSSADRHDVMSAAFH